MSQPVSVEWTETAEELEQRYRAERHVERRKRLGALWRVRLGERIPDAGRVVGVGSRTVDRWLDWYRAGGLREVLRRGPGHGAVGQPHRLTAAQQEALLAHVGRGEFRTYEEARAWVEAEYGVEYRPGGFYTTLHRLGVRPKVPRPVAEKADPAARAAWRVGG
jgi:transposase